MEWTHSGPAEVPRGHRVGREDEIVSTWARAAELERPPLIVLEPLAAFLGDAVLLADGATLTVRAIGEGVSNATFLLELGGERKAVLRRPPRGPLPPSTHDVLREARVLAALRQSAVPVPDVLSTCSDTSLIGAPFAVVEFVEGDVAHLTEPAALSTPWERHAFGLRFVETLAALHAVEPERVGLGDLGRADGYLERQLRRHLRIWEQNRTRDLPKVAEIAAWLQGRMPRDGRTTLVHGDYHPGNVIVAPDPPARIAAVLDWETCTLGDPLADLGYASAMWFEASDPQDNPLERAPLTRAPGYPTRAELVGHYEQVASVEVAELLPWYEVLALWRAIVFMEYNYSRAAAGADDRPYLLGIGEQIPRLAELASARIP